MFDGRTTTDAGEWTANARTETWREIDRALRVIAKRRGALDREEAVLLCRAARREIWRKAGAASLFAYLEEVLGYGPKCARERVRIAEALDAMPELAAALGDGELHYSSVRELTRVAIRATEREWIAAARGKNLRQIEELVASHRKGDRPSDPADPDLAPKIIRFEVSTATLARLRQVQQVLADEHGCQLDDDALVAALCGAVLDGDSREDHGRARFQILTTVCPACQNASQQGGARALPIEPHEVARAECDAQRIGADQRARQDIAPKVRRFVWARDGGRCTVPGCRAARHIDVHHIIARADGGSHAAENLTLLCSAHHRELHKGTLAITGRAPAITIRSVAAHVGRMHEPLPTISGALRADATLALTTLGFSKAEATPMVERAVAASPPDTTLEQLIRLALRRPS